MNENYLMNIEISHPDQMQALLMTQVGSADVPKQDDVSVRLCSRSRGSYVFNPVHHHVWMSVSPYERSELGAADVQR